MARIVCCARCGRDRNHHARGMCASCCSIVSFQGRLDDYDRLTRPVAVLADDYRILAGRGLTVVEIAARLGYTRANTLRSAVARACERGLLPRTHLAGLWADADWRRQPLSPQERRMLQLAATGVTDLGARMGLARSTVRSYRSRIRCKLGASTWDDAVRAYVAEAVLVS